MNILSLFDGISCARMAIGRSGISYEEYYASEIDKYALEISGKNFLKAPINLGDVRTINAGCVKDVGLIIGGSPCQDLSISNKERKGLSGSRSCLFWEFARLVKEVNPKYFLLENVASMPKEAKEIISKELGVEPIMVNAALVSAQNRKRLFWTNIPNVTQPNDRGIFLKDILLDDVDEKYFVKSNNWRIFRNLTPSDKKARCLNASAWKGAQNDGTTLVYVGRCGNKNIINDGKELSRNAPQGDRIYSPSGKVATLSANGGGRGAKTGLYCVKIGALGSDKQGDGIYDVSGKSPSLRVGGDQARGAIIGVGVNRKDGIRGEIDKSYPILSSQYRGLNCNQTQTGVVHACALRNRGEGKKPEIGGDKANALTTVQTDSMTTDGIRVRKLTPIECERLQSLPDDYTKGISDTQRYRCLGNAFNVDVVAHILSFIPKGDGFYAEERKNFDTDPIAKNEQSPVLHNGFCS